VSIDRVAYALSNQGTVASYKQSETLYEHALSFEPDYAAAWTGRSVNYFRMVGASLLSPNEGYGLRIQPVDATQWPKRSAGVSKPSVALGRSFSRRAMALSLF